MRTEKYIYSKTFDFYLVLPMKTGSVTASWIFTYFDFFTYTRKIFDNYEYDDILTPYLAMVHSYYLPPEEKNPKIIVTSRNPYDRMLSRFLFTWGKNELPSVDDFEMHIINSIETSNPLYIMPDYISPTYTIRLENLLDDYKKIPFIANSKLISSGIIEEMTNKKINENRIKVDREQYLTRRNKELIYDFMRNQFELFGYKK